ncbi:MAG: carbamoyltransferase N-terminal domain-containing protein [Bacteroidota bacterium]|nr:carbamoyltransferase N-terminal domain-containing protein [Bacteroidota bacterium]
MNILGISCYYHDSAACLVKDGEVVAAVQEERFNRIKNSSDFPLNAINYCIQAGNISFNEIDYIGFYEKPYLKFSRVIIDHIKAFPYSYRNFLRTIPNWLQDRLSLPIYLKKELSYEGKVLFIKHHLAHAASSFLVSPFENAAILTVDGVGEMATLSCGIGSGNKIDIKKEIHYPDSLGLIYTAVTTYLGFAANSGEGKTMGLAGYGNPVYLDKFKEIVDIASDGSFRIDQSYFGFNKGKRMYSNKFVKTFGKPKSKNEEFNQRHYDIAASLQRLVEDTILAIAKNLYDETKVDKLCMAGGVSLNCVTNQRILEETPFKEIFIQPAAGDAGAALGVAMYIHNCMLDNPRSFVMNNAYMGPEYTEEQMKRSLLKAGLDFKRYENDELTKYIAAKIADNNTVGWFQGRLEFGPRALGNRSILGNPCNNEIKDVLNKKIKQREPFRPFAPVVHEDKANDYFEMYGNSPFMLLAPRVKEDMKSKVPAITHIDGTARVQTINRDSNPILWDLINEFGKITGVYLVINTSFNRQEPIVCSPDEAISCYNRTKMDYLVLGNFVVERGNEEAEK